MLKAICGKPAVVAFATLTIALAGLSAAGATLNDGLAVYLPFNGDMANKSTSGVAVQAAPEPSATCATLVNNGFVGQCLDITTSGSDYGYLKLPGTDAGSLAYPNNKTFSAILWLRRSVNWTSDPIVFGNNSWAGKEKGFIFAAAQGGKSHVNMHAADGSNRFDLYFDWEATGIWTFYAVVGDNGTFRVYQGKSAADSALGKQTTTLANFTLATGYPFCIGQRPTDFAYPNKFTGAIDDFALWNRALTEEEIQRIYECGRAGMELGDVLKIDAHDEPTMTVDASDNDSVTLSFGGRRTQPLALCLAYGAADGGADKYAWTSFSNLTEVAVGDASYTFTVPAWMKTNLRYRFFLMQTNSLPYAKEVKYVKSAGTSYIDTGVAPRRWMTAEFDVMPESQNGKWDWMFGAMASDKASNFGLAHCPQDLWHLEVSGVNQKPSGATLGELHHLKFNAVLSSFDGVLYTPMVDMAHFVESGWTVNLFRNVKNGSQYDQTLKGWFESFAIYMPERKVRDFKPVVDGNGTAGMFDAVTCRFYPSASAAALTAGEDLDPLRYGWVRAVTGGDAFVAIADATPVAAAYTGGGADPLDLSDSGNWTCYNLNGQEIRDGVPTSETAVTVSGATRFAVPEPTVWRSIKFEGAALQADADMRGMDLSKVVAGSSIDLQGHALQIAGFDGEMTASVAVTDSSANASSPGVLTIDVPANKIFAGGSLALSGNLRLAKTGAGMYAASAANTYTGGTYVPAGTLRLGAELAACLGSGLVTVGDGTETGATIDAYAFDMNGAGSAGLVLAGGTITSSRATGNAIMLPLRLTVADADSYITYGAFSAGHDMNVPVGATWNLGGRTLLLTLNGQDPDMGACELLTSGEGAWTMSNGTFRVAVKLENTTTKTGWLHIRGLNGKDGLSLDIGNSDPRLNYIRNNVSQTSSVWNFTSSTPLNKSVVSDGTSVLEIYGTYTPNSAYAFRMMMMDGSAIDLTSKTGAWSTAVAKGVPLAFSENARITVNLAGRTDLKTIAKSGSPYVVTWSTRPAATTTFALDAATAAAGYKCEVTDAGLKLFRPMGIVIIVK